MHKMCVKISAAPTITVILHHSRPGLTGMDHHHLRG